MEGRADRREIPASMSKSMPKKIISNATSTTAFYLDLDLERNLQLKRGAGISFPHTERPIGYSTQYTQQNPTNYTTGLHRSTALHSQSQCYVRNMNMDGELRGPNNARQEALRTRPRATLKPGIVARGAKHVPDNEAARRLRPTARAARDTPAQPLMSCDLGPHFFKVDVRTF